MIYKAIILCLISMSHPLKYSGLKTSDINTAKPTKTMHIVNGDPHFSKPTLTDVGKKIRYVEPDNKRLKKNVSKFVDIDSFGAKANDKDFDNSAIIAKAITSAKNIVFKKGRFYAIRNQILVSHVDNINLDLNGSSVINMNYDTKTFRFEGCNNVNITGGTLTRPEVPTIQNGKDQHTLSFLFGSNISVTKMHISNSPEMGINLMNVVGATMLNNTIEHTLRDGIYAQYSVKIKYIGNTLSYIKDDALSIHDYGIKAQKPEIIKAGYQQAGYATISGNTIYNAIQGISSIGCTSLIISDNQINRTANAGIAVFNSETLFVGSTARVNNIKITNNILKNCGDTAFVNGIRIPNGGQLSSGRAAIYLACNGKDNFYVDGTLRLSKIYVANNIVTNSAVNGILCSNIDGLQLLNNNFINCHSNTKNAPQFTGNICEIFNCTNIIATGNNVTDHRKAPLHDSSYIINNSSGSFTKGHDVGWRSFEIKILNSPNLKVTNTGKQ